jgi:hypothetical protein
MFRTVTATAAWTSLAFIAYATLSPLNERPELHTDLFSHLDQYLAYAVAGSLFGLAYPRQTFFVCILVLGSAVLLELLQLLTPDRHARVIDAVRKSLAGQSALGSHTLRSRFIGRRPNTERTQSIFGRSKHWIMIKNRKHPAFDRVQEVHRRA